MKKTFYIATGSINPEHRKRVEQLAQRLFQDFGWVNKFDWTDGFMEESKYPRHELIYRVKMDLEAAHTCDVFIFLETQPSSIGANREWGARWASGKNIYRVSSYEDHMFDMIDAVISVETDEELIDVLDRRERS